MSIARNTEMHAKSRELTRIERILTSAGVDFLVGEEEDEGFFLGIDRDRHKPDCQLENGGKCRCKEQYRIKGH